MGKGANKQLLNNAGTGQQAQKQLQANANAVTDHLTPQLENQANNPQGYTPQQLAYMNTASQQSEGGSTAGITGQANLEAARTRNAGGFQGAIGSASREAQRNLSQNALNIQTKQAELQQQQRQAALQQLQSLYGTEQGGALSYLGASNTALNAENQASGANGLAGQAILTGIKAAGQVGGAAAGG